MPPIAHRAGGGRQDRKRCWNCRERKTACDRTLPSCQNCERRGQVCLGYDLKLSWPQDDNNRRFVRDVDHYLLPVRSSTIDFVNTSSQDIDRSHRLVELRNSPTSSDMLWISRLPYHTVGPQQIFPTQDYVSVARLASSSLENDDLYGLLLKLSMNDEELPTKAARHAISALSYQHRDVEKALLHQTSAIRALQSAIENFDPSRAIQVMAASMMLNIFEVLNYDSSKLGWSIFFCGTKSIVSRVTKPDDTYYGDEAIILDWIFYHDAMYKFSIKHWIDKNDDQIKLAAQKKIISKAVFAPERQNIVPALGCSLEILDLLCQSVDAVLDRKDTLYLSPTHLATLKSLEIRLRSVEQRYTGILDTDPYRTHVAELYRLSILIYLYRVVRGEPRDCMVVEELVDQSFALLKDMEFCLRPWPLFIIALEAHNEDHRKTVLTVLEGSLMNRPLCSIQLVNRMIRDAWVQEDLHAGEIDRLTLYNAVISNNRIPPSFS